MIRNILIAIGLGLVIYMSAGARGGSARLAEAFRNPDVVGSGAPSRAAADQPPPRAGASAAISAEPAAIVEAPPESAEHPVAIAEAPLESAEHPAAIAEAPLETPEAATDIGERPVGAVAPSQAIRVLMIGDRFVRDWYLDDRLEELAASGTPPTGVDAARVALEGTSLYGHWVGVRAVPTLQEQSWDVVILQDDLYYLARNPDRFYEYFRRFHALSRANGAEPVLFLPWLNEDADSATVSELDAAYAALGTLLGAQIAPVGPAWRSARVARPALDLYATDRKHASLAGAYLTVAVLYGTIFGESPEGLPYRPRDLVRGRYAEWQISEDDLAFLQRIAWETVVAYRHASPPQQALTLTGDQSK